MWRNDSRRRVRRYPAEHYQSTHFVQRQTSPTLRIMGAFNTVFQQDNVRSHVARRTFNNLTGFDILPWPANSPNLNSIEHLWDLIGRDMNREAVAKNRG
ncbi:hypothetical protein TNCV_2189561 [Trichonephila clavipes]|nr:hypothetical protein TNCV_2189561 [Trichonephila clavipes]